MFIDNIIYPDLNRRVIICLRTKVSYRDINRQLFESIATRGLSLFDLRNHSRHRNFSFYHV